MSEDLNHLRELRFGDLLEAKEEARALLERGYTCRGNWTLGQICRHLCLVQDPSIDGYPAWMSLFAFLRPAMRRFLLPRLMSGDSPKGIRTSRAFVPADELDDASEVARFSESVKRFREHQGAHAPHPAFGRMERHALERLHAAHAAHHLRFLLPYSDRTRAET